MALSEKHRSELYQYFEPALGAEVTEAMLREFPRGSGGEVVTREYLDLRLDALASQLRSEMVGLTGRLTVVLLGAASVIIAAIAVATTVIIAAAG